MKTNERFAGTKIIVIGDNRCWGRGDTLNEAKRNASNPRKWTAYIVTDDTTVSEFDASFTWTRGEAPRLIAYHGTKPDLSRLLASSGDSEDQ